MSTREYGPLLLARYSNLYARRGMNMTGCVPSEAWSGDSRPRPLRSVAGFGSF